MSSDDRVSLLLVGDDLERLVSSEAVLVAPSYAFARAASAEEALRLAHATDFAVILIHVSGPGTEEVETAKRIRAGARSGRTPVIFLTRGSSASFPIEEAYALGATDVVAESFAPVVLRAKVAVFVELFRHTREANRAGHERTEAAAHGLWRTTLASIGDAVISTDVQGRVTFLNPVAEELTGWALADATGRPLTEVFRIVNESTRSPVDNPALRALETGTIVGLANHTILIARDGTERPIDDSAAPIRDAGGTVSGAVLVFRDISGRKRAEAAQARLAAIVESSTDAIVGKTLEGVVQSWNAGAERVFGYTAAEAVGRSITFLLPPERLHEEDEILKRVRNGERTEYLETVRVRKGGERIDVSVSISPVRGYGGEIVGASKTARDITLLKRNERALAESRRRSESALQAGEVGTYYWDVAADRVTGDRNFVALFGVVPDDRSAAPVGDFLTAVHPDDRERVGREIGRTLADDTPFRSEYRVAGPAGERWVLARGAVERDPAGAAVGWAGVVVDITDRKAAAAALAASRARLDYAVRVSGLGFWYCDLPFDVLEWDERVKAHFWLPPGARVTIATFYDRIHPDDREPTRAAIERSVAGHTGYDVHYRTVDPATKAEKWIRAIGGTYYDAAGAPRRFDGVTLDVTDQRRAEAAVRESSDRFNIVARATNDAVWDWDMRTNAVWWNDGVTTLFGYRPQDVDPDATWWYEQIHPDERERVVSGIHAVIDHGGANWSDEYRFRKADGTYATVLDRGHAIHERGKTVRLVGAMQDVTDRRRAEERLRESEARFRSLFESMDEGYCVVEPVLDDAGRAVDYRYLLVNPAFEAHTGLRDAVGKTAREVMPTHESHWIEAYAHVAATGETVRRTDRVADLGRWFEVSAFRVGGPAGRHVGVLFTDITQRKRAEEALVASERQLAEVFRHAPSFMAVLRGPGHVFERVNARYERLVGARPLLGLTAREALPELVAQGFVDALDRVYRSGEPDTGTGARVALAPGQGRVPEARYLDFVYQPVRDAAGAVTGVIVQGVDQTERKRAEALLREKDERLQLLLENAADYAVVITDAGGVVLDWLGGAAAVTGYAPADVLGRPADVFFTPEDRAAGVPAREMATAARAGRAEDKRWHQKKNGDQFFADGVMVALRSGGELRGFGKVFRDATALKRSADAVQFLAHASASLSELVDYQSTLGRIANLATGGFADWCVVDMFDENGGRRRLTVTAKESGDVTAARESDATFRPADEPGAVPHVLRTGEPEVVPDVFALDPETAPQGAERVNRLRGMGVRSYLSVPLVSRGQVIGGMTFLASSPRRRFGQEELRVAQNLAERVTVAIENARLYHALQEQDRRKDEFLATLAHELRNPLAPVRNGVQILRATLPPEPRVEKTLGMMERQLGQMVHLVDDLMDVSRVSSGKVVLRKQRIDLRAVLDAAVETSRQMIEAARHELVVQLPDTRLALDADQTRLVQVFANLLNNAAKYTPHGGRIALTAEPLGDDVVVRVTDTGVGIPAEMLPKVFDMFTQVGTSLERSQGGLGIGLTLVKRLVELHGGSVTAESPGPGHGSTFAVRLPLAPDPARAANGAGGGALAPGERTLSVLVVDDNRDAAESLALVLEMKGHQVHTAHDGPEALRVLGTFRPDLILLDLGLPGMSGYEVARRIRESTDLAGVTLVALTGWGQEEDRRRTREAGFDHHLVKPADLAALERILRGGP